MVSFIVSQSILLLQLKIMQGRQSTKLYIFVDCTFGNFTPINRHYYFDHTLRVFYFKTISSYGLVLCKGVPSLYVSHFFFPTSTVSFEKLNCVLVRISSIVHICSFICAFFIADMSERIVAQSHA